MNMTLGTDKKQLQNGASTGNDENMDIDEKNTSSSPPTATAGGGATDCLPMDDAGADDDENDKYKPDATFRFELKNFTEFAKGHEQQRLSPSTYVRGLPWKILAIPRDNNRGDRRTKALGFFLQCNADAEHTTWNCSAQAVLKVISQKEGVDNHERKISHTFYPKENDWGYSQFMLCDNLLNPDEGYIKDDTIILEVYVNADAPHGVQWDSKKHTGFIGLKNQGATCYMNSLLQTLYFTNKLRKAVYQMPTEHDDPETSVALAMQRVFYDLQHSDRPVATKKLTRSFGWDTFESFLQHDVQELCRVLLDNLESKMKSTLVDRTIPKLFEGKMKSYIRCKNVDFESSREEAFYDVQLNIKGKKNITDSFQDYIETEILDGDNKYDAGDYGLQPAEKGVKFITFPPVLHLQLMRFQYDPIQDANVKINDRYEFPERLDLSDFIEKGAGDGIYMLHAVLVHSGDFHGGHYVVFINTNPRGNGRWCKFDDDVVSRATVKDAVLANYGGEDPDMPQRAFTNAYMLVYIRHAAIGDVLGPVNECDIPQHLKERFEEEKEQDLQRKKEKQDAHLFTIVNVVSEELMTSHHGFDLFDPELVETMARKFKIEKKLTINELYDKIGESYNLKPMSQFRLWCLSESAGVDHQQYRPVGPTSTLVRNRPCKLLMPDERSPLPTIRKDRIDSILSDEKNLVFIELSTVPGPLPKYDDNLDVLAFLKYYDAKSGQLQYVGHLMVVFNGSLRPYLAEMCRRAHLPPNTELLLFEEISPDKVLEIKSIDKSANVGETLTDQKDGLIIVYQRADYAPTYGTAAKLFDKMYSDIDVEIIDQGDADAKPILGRISLTWKLEELLQWIGKEINYDPYKIQLNRTNAYNDKMGSAIPMDRGDQFRHVRDVLSLTGNAKHDPRKERRYRIYYAKMPVRVDELDRRKEMKLQWMDAKLAITNITVYPDKSGTVKTILEEVSKQVQLSSDGSGQLRLVFAGISPHTLRVYQIFQPDTTVSEVSQKISSPSYTARVEEIPIDQVSVNASTEYLLPVGHFDKDPQRMFGVPFFIKVKQSESFTAVRDRIKKMLDISDKDFEKYKFALVANGRVVRYLDGELSSHTVNLSELGQTHATGVQSQPWLGLDHMNKSRGTRGSHTLEKPIVIHN